VIPAWVGKYVGSDFASHGRGPDEFDCWGLVRWVLLREYGIEAPDFGEEYEHPTDAEGIPKAIETGKAGWCRVSDAREGDVVVLNVYGKPMHCGVVVSPGFMLHTRRGVGSCVESYERPLWKPRLEGVYRHRARCN